MKEGTKKSSRSAAAVVDTNRFRNGCSFTTMCKACTCFKVDMLTTPVGSLKAIQVVRALKFKICFTLSFNFQFTPSTIFIKLSQVMKQNGALLLVYYKNFSFQLSNLKISEKIYFCIFRITRAQKRFISGIISQVEKRRFFSDFFDDDVGTIKWLM